MNPCLDLVRFADGELEPEGADAFRSHLESCADCRSGLLEAIQLGVRLGALNPPSEHVAPAPQSRAQSPEVLPLSPAPASWTPARGRKPRLPYWTATVFAAAIVLIILLIRPPTTPPPPNAFAGLTARPFDVRIAYGDAAPYLPTQDHMLGAAGASGDAISYAALDAYQKHHDGHALAIAQAYNGEDLTRVAEQLRKLEPRTPAIRSDLAAIEILTTREDNTEPVLAELEALQRSDDPAVARTARWNYALLLSRLDLPLSAARVFRAIADGHEPGWAEEARMRADAQDARGSELAAAWQRAYKAGEALVTSGTPVPPELVRAVPSLLRGYLYSAVRTAPDPARVLALGPMAAELDRLGETRVLSSYVERVARLDFRRRAPLAAALAQLLHNQPIPGSARAELLAAAASDDAFDIAMGAMIELEVIPDHLASFARMAKRTGDPWFQVVLARTEAGVDVKRGNWLDAEARLRKAEKLCSPAIIYQCLLLARQLGGLYQDLHRVHDALAVLREAVHAARSAGEWARYRLVLWKLADVERFHSSTAAARAYANEVLLMTPGDELRSWTYQVLAGAALLDVDGREARRDLDEALVSSAPDQSTANLLTDIARLDPRPDDLARLQGWLGKLRNGGTMTVADRVLADEIEGRLVIEQDRAAGSRLLRAAIAAAEQLPHDVVADKARAGAYSVLALDAARHGDHAEVLRLIAQDLGLPVPGACTVAMVAEDERAVIVVRGADGHDHAAYDASRGPRSAALAVSDGLARDLETCAHVQVMAPAALQGQSRVLPPGLPWSYVTSARGRAPGSSKVPAEPRTLIVTDVTPPAYLKLAPLLARPPESHPSSTLLSGPAATPTRVLAEMVEAREIQFHTHALLDVGQSDASHLVLSSEPDGRYALTAEAIRGIELRGHPIIVLAACHSAQGARYQHAPWSLPDAFLAVGARAVFAAAREIPDREAAAFFDRVLAKVRAGADPAVALRDLRTAVLASNPSSWVADVILFE
jgi:cellulose synthase operon protein C